MICAIYSSVVYTMIADTNSSQYNVKSIGLILIITINSFLVFWCVVGLFAIWKNNNCLLTLYNISIIYILLISLAIFSLLLFVSFKISQYKADEECKKEFYLKRLYQLNHQASLIFCQPDQCDCLFKGDQQMVKEQEILFIQGNSTSIRVQDCIQYQNDGFDGLRYLSPFLRILEETFECSGICTQNKFYRFSDINKGKPNAKCQEKVIRIVSNYINYFLSASLIISFASLINLIFSFKFQYIKSKNQDYMKYYPGGSYQLTLQ